jgi:hypothetical protein
MYEVAKKVGIYYAERPEKNETCKDDFELVSSQPATPKQSGDFFLARISLSPGIFIGLRATLLHYSLP